MYCKYCGNEIKENEKFCTKCGNQIGNNIERKANNQDNSSKLSNFIKNNKVIITISIVVILIIIIGAITYVILNNNRLSTPTTTSLDSTKKDNKEVIRTDDTAETGITYNFTLNELQTSLDKICNLNNINKFTAFKYTTSNDYNMIYESYSNANSNTDCLIIVQIHNNYIASIAYRYSNENIEFGESTGKNIFFSTLKELFGNEYANSIIETLGKLENNKCKYNNYTLSMKTKIEQEGINQYEITAISPEYAEKLMVLYPNSYNLDENVNNAETSNLLEEIYKKYPDLRGEGSIVCHDEDNYWLLDKEGKKVYFYDLESFENALRERNTIEPTENTNSSNTNDNSNIIDIPNIEGITKTEAVKILKKYNIPYKLVYRENLWKEEDIITGGITVNNKDSDQYNEIGEDGFGYGLYKINIDTQTAIIEVNRYKERDISIVVYRTCLVLEAIQQNIYTNEFINKNLPLNLTVKINDNTVLEDKLTSNDIKEGRYGIDYISTTSNIKYTSKEDLKISTYINGRLITEDIYGFKDSIKNESTGIYNPSYASTSEISIGFIGYGAG